MFNLFTSIYSFPPVRNLHVIKSSVLSPILLPAEWISVGVTPMSVDVLWNPHLGRDVSCVRCCVIEILNKFFLGHLLNLCRFNVWNDISININE